MNKKLLIGLGIAAIATTVIAVGIYRELKAIKELTIDDAEELPEDLVNGVDEVQVLADEEF